MKNISKNYFELKIVQSDEISKVDTLALEKNSVWEKDRFLNSIKLVIFSLKMLQKWNLLGFFFL